MSDLMDNPRPIRPLFTNYSIGVFTMIIALLIAFTSVAVMINQYRSEKTTTGELGKLIDRMHTISAGVTFEQTRTRTLLCIRDYIREINPKLSADEAYDIAKVDLEMCERYDAVPILLLVSIQRWESKFDKTAISPKNARGINQIFPSTGRMLCKGFGWEYDINILHDVKRSTKLAVSLLDTLLVEHENNVQYVLAEYNGGPGVCSSFKKNLKVPLETTNYVKNVSKTMNSLQKLIDNYPLRIVLISRDT